MAEPSGAAATAHSIPPGSASTGWIFFLVVMLVTALVDVLCVSRIRPNSPSRFCRLPVYAKQIIFWLFSGIFFVCVVWQLMGVEAAGSWLYGYVLEYSLSVDNLFVFQLVFKGYSTPESQLDRALFWGISAAILLRLAFFEVGTVLLDAGFFARLAFGVVLVYSGYKTLKDEDDEEDDPSQNCIVRSLARILPLHDQYSEEPVFLVSVLQEEDGTPKPSVIGSPSALELQGLSENEEGASPTASTPSGSRGTYVWKLTPLFMVVLTLGIIDVIFAVDSVTAKISSMAGFQPNVSFFLNLTSSAFAMFVLRSLYMVVDALSHMFRLLKYGVGAVLILIGLKLVLAGYLEIGNLTSGALIISLLLLSIVASVVLPAPAEEEQAADEAGAERGDEKANADKANEAAVS
eukprot:TRINITY_DN103050_c0_g1_i1.p1 TRINITY_DN103050_c0_g1~~TRINITY_DN103050_c0_g1_i1.p1  ORF type:complete len:414 (+),score=75.51 TRINITY_DN103050_c0_g1_i1:29-1243(+)